MRQWMRRPTVRRQKSRKFRRLLRLRAGLELGLVSCFGATAELLVGKSMESLGSQKPVLTPVGLEVAWHSKTSIHLVALWSVM